MARWLAALTTLTLVACGGGQGDRAPAEGQAGRVWAEAAAGADADAAAGSGPDTLLPAGTRTAISDDLAYALEGGDVNKTLDAIDALSRQRDDQAIGPLLQASLSASAEVRSAVVDALADIGTDQATLGLLFALDDPEVEVREDAVEALEDIGSATALDLLGQALADEDPEVRELAAGAIGAMR